MRDLKVTFGSDGPLLDLNSSVSGLDEAAQVIAISLGTSVGSDLFAPSRGNRLFLTFARNGLVSPQSAQHQANFAAVGTKVFYNSLPTDNPLSGIILTVAVDSPERLRLSTNLVFSSQEAATLNIVV